MAYICFSYVVIDKTADRNRVYPYPTERLWFVEHNGFTYATMAVSPDDAISSVQDSMRKPLIEPTVPLRGLLEIPADYGVETPPTHGDYMGIRRSDADLAHMNHGQWPAAHDDPEEKRRDELRVWARQHGVVVPFRFLYPEMFPARPKPKSPLLIALKSAERFVRDALADTMALHQLAAQDGHDDLYRGTLDNATETLRIIQAAIVKGETE